MIQCTRYWRCPERSVSGTSRLHHRSLLTSFLILLWNRHRDKGLVSWSSDSVLFLFILQLSFSSFFFYSCPHLSPLCWCRWPFQCTWSHSNIPWYWRSSRQCFRTGWIHCIRFPKIECMSLGIEWVFRNLVDQNTMGLSIYWVCSIF